MSPAIRDGEIVYVEPVAPADLRTGNIVLVRAELGFRLHRLVVADVKRNLFITRGDCGQQDDPAVGGESVLGIAVSKEVLLGARRVRADLSGVRGVALRGLARGLRAVQSSWKFLRSLAARRRHVAPV